jgi:hypothetical protein
VRWLLDYAAQQASGLAAWERDTDHIEKASSGGMPARNGVSRALVSLGWNGVDVFSGEPSSSDVAGRHPATLVDRLGYGVTRTT